MHQSIAQIKNVKPYTTAIGHLLELGRKIKQLTVPGPQQTREAAVTMKNALESFLFCSTGTESSSYCCRVRTNSNQGKSRYVRQYNHQMIEV